MKANERSFTNLINRCMKGRIVINNLCSYELLTVYLVQTYCQGYGC